jgi:hypothetical protein
MYMYCRIKMFPLLKKPRSQIVVQIAHILFIIPLQNIVGYQEIMSIFLHMSVPSARMHSIGMKCQNFLYFSRFRINSLERLLYLADFFVWEDLPTTDPRTGSLTAAGWIPRIQTVTRRLINTTIIFHFSYVFLKRIESTKPRLSYNSWYPFETTNTFVFELVNASQVK